MARVAINTGATPNDGTGDSLRAAGGIINNNFLEIYTHLGAGSTTILPAPIWDITSVGINTLKNVGIGTTNPRFALEVGAVGASGTTVFVNGDTRVTGIVTANSFRGSGTNLTGIVTSIVAGTNVTISGSTGQVTINASGGGGGSSQWATTAAGINTLSNVGIGTTNPTSALTVNGSALITGLSTFSDTLAVRNEFGVAVLTVGHDVDGTGTDHLGIYYDNISGVPGIGGTASVFTSNGDLRLDVNDGTSNIIFGNAISDHVVINGTSGNVGIGTTNARFPLEVGAVGASGTTLLVNGDARITGILTVGTASITIDGSTNTLTVPNLVVTNSTTGVTASGVGISVRDGGGDLGSASIIDFGNNLTVSFAAGIATITGAAGGGASSQWATTTAGINTLSNVGIGTTNPTSALTVKGNTSLETLNVSGIATFQSGFNVNSFTRYGDGVYQYFGNSDDLLVAHISAGTERSVVSSSTGHPLQIFSNDLSLRSQTDEIFASFASNGSASLYHDNSKKFETLGAGVTVTGTTFTNQLSVSGVSTFNNDVNFIGQTYNAFWDQSLYQGCLKFEDNASLVFGTSDDFRIYYSDFSTKFDGTVLLTGGLSVRTGLGTLAHFGNWSGVGNNVELYFSESKKFETIGAGVTVTGTTFTNQLSVSGISTLNSNVSVGGTISVNGGVRLTTNNPTIVGTSGTVGEIKRIGGAPFFYDGSAWREFVLSSGTPVSVPADTEWNNVVFRATFDTDFTDAKFGATPSYVSSGSTIVGAAVTIGTGAFRNNGTLGAGVSYAYRSDYDFTGSWTIEFWMYVDSGPVYVGNPTSPTSLISMNSTTGIGTSGNWSLAQYRDQYGNVYISWFNQNHPTYKNGTTLYNVAGVSWGSSIIDKWNHFALVREGDNGSLHFYVNGTEQYTTAGDGIIDNDILDINGNGLHFGGDTTFTIGGLTFNSVDVADVIFDDVRISAGVGTAGQRYNSIGISTYATFTPPTTALPTTGTLSSYIQPPGDKYGEITLGGSPTWRGTSGVTVSQQSSGNYRVSFASSYTNYNDYFVLTQPMDQGFASYVGVARSTTHVDFAVNRESDNSAVNTGSLSVQIKNHI